jgi:hypothetical protein
VREVVSQFQPSAKRGVTRIVLALVAESIRKVNFSLWTLSLETRFSLANWKYLCQRIVELKSVSKAVPSKGGVIVRGELSALIHWIFERFASSTNSVVLKTICRS